MALFKAVSASPTGAIGGSCVGGDVLGAILWSPGVVCLCWWPWRNLINCK